MRPSSFAYEPMLSRLKSLLGFKDRRLLPEFVEVGNHTIFSSRCHFNSWVPGERIIIGKYCSIAAGVHFVVGGNHPIQNVSTFAFDNIFLGKSNPTRTYQGTGETIIGHDVWIGMGAYIGAGVNVGHGCVIGARAVVGQSPPPYSLVIGDPGRVVKSRFSAAQIERLLRLAWWDSPTRRCEATLSGSIGRYQSF